MIYFENQFAIVSWDAEIRVVKLERIGFSNGEVFKIPARKVFELFTMHKGNKLLMDITKASVVDQEDQKWVTREWFPQCIGLGLRYFAIVVPESAIGRLSLDQVAKTMDSKPKAEAPKNTPDNIIQPEVMHFPSIEKAREWLRDCDAPSQK